MPRRKGCHRFDNIVDVINRERERERGSERKRERERERERGMLSASVGNLVYNISGAILTPSPPLKTPLSFFLRSSP